MIRLVAVGNVVKEFRIGNTNIRICDDYCKDKSESAVKEILARIAENALNALTIVADREERSDLL